MTAPRPSPQHSLSGALAVGAFIAAVAVVIFVTAGGVAHPHEFYDPSCCDDRDCRPQITEMVVGETPDGYHVEALKQTIPYDDARIRFSPDNRFHLCLYSLGTGHGLAVRCLYVPPRSF